MARKPTEKLPTNPEEIDGITKAAILLMTLDTPTAGAMLKQLPPAAVEEVTRELASLGRVPEELRTAVVEEFYGNAVADQFITQGGLDYAKVLLKESLDGPTADRRWPRT